MSLRKIARMGHPVLLERCLDVPDPTEPLIRLLAADMVETMLDANGIGIAAPQVHETLRMIVALPIRERGDDRDVAPLVLVNPTIAPLDEVRESAFEGCLSIPDLRGVVSRWHRVGFQALSLDGKPLEGEASGLFARILQHEVDHLDGVLFPARMHDLRSLSFTSELHHQLRPQGVAS